MRWCTGTMVTTHPVHIPPNSINQEKNDLNESLRSRMIDLLNQQLADTFDFLEAHVQA